MVFGRMVNWVKLSLISSPPIKGLFWEEVLFVEVQLEEDVVVLLQAEDSSPEENLLLIDDLLEVADSLSELESFEQTIRRR